MHKWPDCEEWSAQTLLMNSHCPNEVITLPKLPLSCQPTTRKQHTVSTTSFPWLWAENNPKFFGGAGLYAPNLLNWKQTSWAICFCLQATTLLSLFVWTHPWWLSPRMYPQTCVWDWTVSSANCKILWQADTLIMSAIWTAWCAFMWSVYKRDELPF